MTHQKTMKSQRWRGLSKGTLRISAAEPGLRSQPPISQGFSPCSPLHQWLPSLSILTFDQVFASTCGYCSYKLLMWPNSQHLWWIFSLRFNFLKISPSECLPRKRQPLSHGLSPLTAMCKPNGPSETKQFLQKRKGVFGIGLKVKVLWSCYLSMYLHYHFIRQSRRWRKPTAIP